MIYDFGIVGGGIVGLATALSLIELRPGVRLVLIEKENRLAAHQTCDEDDRADRKHD